MSSDVVKCPKDWFSVRETCRENKDMVCRGRAKKPARAQREDTMQITDVRVRIVDGNAKMKAVASITLDEAFAIHDIKVIEGERGLFVAMPNKKMPNGEYRDVAHPIHSGMRAVLEEVILGEYYNVLKA